MRIPRIFQSYPFIVYRAIINYCNFLFKIKYKKYLTKIGRTMNGCDWRISGILTKRIRCDKKKFQKVILYYNKYCKTRFVFSQNGS